MATTAANLPIRTGITTPDIFLRDIVDPALRGFQILTGTVSGDAARVIVMAIAGQESNWSARRQDGGPARSFWQFEKGGGVAQVFMHAGDRLKPWCEALHIPFDQSTVFEAMAWNDDLACAMARLLLWTDARALPELGDQAGGWQYYLDNWRPGAPHPDVWPRVYGQSAALVRARPTPAR